MHIRRDALSRAAKLMLGVAFTVAASGVLDAQASIDPRAASAYVQDLGHQTIDVLAKKLPPPQREQQLSALLRRGFDLAYLSRLALGRSWRDLNDDQRDEYQQAFDVWVLRTYAARLANYGGQQFQVIGADAANDDVVVRSEIKGGGAPTARVDWRVRMQGAEFRIIDVVVEGVSMVVTHRNEFQGIIQRQGVNGLIETLRARAERASAQPA